jgi:hypothetical protein
MIAAAISAAAASGAVTGQTGGRPDGASGAHLGERPVFVDRTRETGLDFVHDHGGSGNLWLPEVIGAGGALFDYDNDGDLDLLAVQGGPLDPDRRVRAPSSRAGSRLYRNDLGPEGPRWVDVTERSGLVAAGHGMGAATGDFDNDGWVDLYLTSLGANHLFRNDGDGTFTDVTARAGVDDTRWSTSAVFFDYDRDGWLDLFVANYVDFNTNMKRGCFSAAGARDYCNPAVYQGVSDRLFHNDRDGTFTDVTARSGIGADRWRGLGVVAADLNADGWTDLYVANDGDPNQLWINEQGSGRFRDDGLLAGVALSRMGQAQGSMGVDAADVDGDGDEDLFVTNLDNEANTLYVNVGRGLFEDRTIEAGLYRLGFTGFGTRFVDYDHDGRLDLVVVNGAVRHLPAQVRLGDPYPLKQRSQVLQNAGRGRFVEVTEAAAPALTRPAVSRGAAVGDLDNDGATDLVVFDNNGPARVLMSELRSGRRWLGVRVIDARTGSDALHARVDLVRRTGGLLRRRVQTDGSYCAASDPRVVFGLDADGSAQTVRVHWPGGRVEEFAELGVDRYWTLESGKPPRSPK